MHLVLSMPSGRVGMQEWGEDTFWRMWDGSKKDGPVLSFREPLQDAQLAGSYRRDEPEWRSKCSAVRLLSRGLQVHDLSRSASTGLA